MVKIDSNIFSDPDSLFQLACALGYEGSQAELNEIEFEGQVLFRNIPVVDNDNPEPIFDYDEDNMRFEDREYDLVDYRLFLQARAFETLVYPNRLSSTGKAGKMKYAWDTIYHLANQSGLVYTFMKYADENKLSKQYS